MELQHNGRRSVAKWHLIGDDRGIENRSPHAHYTMDNDLKLKAADVKLRFSTEDEFDRIADPERPERMVNPDVALPPKAVVAVFQRTPGV